MVDHPGEHRQPLPAALRRALLDAALAAYEDAGLRGLCHEGRWEAAVDAMRSLDLTPFAERTREIAANISTDGGAGAAAK